MIVPSGVILLWHGSIASIPSGWVICDGSNGTPNLRDRFIVGAGTIYAVGETGGGTAHQHTISTDQADLDAGQDILDSSPAGFFDKTSFGHNHGGATDIVNHLPPYYALAYIMKT